MTRATILNNSYVCRHGYRVPRSHPFSLNDRWEANINGRQIISDYLAKNKVQGVTRTSINTQGDG
jgi:hypothetical protein